MTIFGYTLGELKKAFVAFVTPGVLALIAALTTGAPGDPLVTGPEITGILVAMFGTGGLVFAAKNADKPPAPASNGPATTPVP